MKKKFRLAALLPGFLTLNNAMAISDINADGGADVDLLKQPDNVQLTPLNIKTPLYIASHRSHSSHSSHSSHRSSSGSSYYVPRSSTYSWPSSSSGSSSGSSSSSSPKVYSQPSDSRGEIKSKEKNKADRSTLITMVQTALRINGFYKGKIDGLMGPNTRAAILEYRIANRLGNNSNIDSLLLNSLGLSAP